MAMPKFSASYEQTFHLLLEVLSQPTTSGTIEIPQPSEKDANYFRLRYYAFQRTLLAEADRELMQAAKLHDNPGMQAAKEKALKTKLSKKFSVTIRLKDNGYVVAFTDRDDRFASANDMLMGMLTKQHTETAQAHDTLEETMRKINKAKDDNFLEMLDKPKLDTEALNPTQAFLAETADPKPTLVRTPQWHLEQTILILKHSPKMHTFTREVLGLADQTWFVQELAKTPNLPPHTVLVHQGGINISRIDVDSSALK